MSPMSGRIGRMFKRKEGNEKTPPKALYDDLESAHESIARKGSATSLKTPSRINLPSSPGTTSPSYYSPLQSPLLTSYAIKQPPTAKSGQQSPSSSNSQCLLSNVGSQDDITAHGLEREVQVGVSRLEPSDELTSPRQTATNDFENAAHHPPSQRKYLLSHSKEPLTMLPSTMETSGLRQYAGKNSVRPTLVASDTVDNIVKTYGGHTPDSSRHVSEQGEYLDNVATNDLESHREQMKGDSEPSAHVLSQEVRDHVGGNDLKHLTAPDMPVNGPQDDVAIETALLNEGDQHLADTRPSESSESEAQANLNQYAWSPCPSDNGTDDHDTAPEVHATHLIASQLHRDVSHTYGAASTSAENTSSSPESYGNTRNLLQLSNSQPSKDTASNDNQSGGPLPSVKTSRLAGDLHLSGKGRPRSEHGSSFRGIGRLSGFVSDGTSSRPMSQVEVIESLSELVQSTLKAPSLSETSSLAQYRASNIEDRHITRQAVGAVLGRRHGDIATDLGSGISEVTASSSHNISLDDLQVRKTRDELHSDASNPRTQAATPPGLFGRAATLFTTDSSESRPSLTRNNSRLAKAAAAAGVKEDSRLGRALAGSPEHDWLTETDIKTNGEHTGIAHFDSVLGSSLADNSDSGDLSQTVGSQQSATDLGKDGPMTHPAHPRYNHSWSLLKNLQTGSYAMVPDYISREGSRLPNNTNSQPRSFTNPGSSPHYQHPKPLLKGHPHPLSSSPVITPSRIELRENAQAHELTTQQKRTEIERSNSKYSYVSDDAEKEDQKLFIPSVCVPRSCEAAEDELEVSGCLKAQHQLASSTWLSTLSEAPTTEPSLPLRISSFAKMSVLGRKGNLTGTPEGDGARELGSSLADNSSPGQNFSSSPPILTSSPPVQQLSPIADYTTPVSKPKTAVKAFHRHLEDMDPAGGLENLPSSRAHDSFGYIVNRSADRSSSLWEESPSRNAHDRQHKNRFLQFWGAKTSPPSPLARNEASSPDGTTAPMKPLLGPSSIHSIHHSDEQEHFNWLEYLPPHGPIQKSAVRRNTSGEDDDKIKAAPTGERVSGVQPAATLGHQKRRSTGALLRKYKNKPSDLESRVRWGEEESSPGDRLRQLHRQNSGDSRRFAPVGTAHSSTPPLILDQPAFGPKAARREGMRHSELRTDPFTRPDARFSSPHLYRLPFTNESALLEQAVRCSWMWGLICFFVPVLGVLLGHGFLDGIMSWHTDGLVLAFPRKEKVAVLIYSYTVGVAGLVAFALTMIILCT